MTLLTVFDESRNCLRQWLRTTSHHEPINLQQDPHLTSPHIFHVYLFVFFYSFSTIFSISPLFFKVSECPSANRGGNLGTFKPGMMVKEFDEICFEKEVGVVHGPVETQFGAHLILITRRYEGEEVKK